MTVLLDLGGVSRAAIVEKIPELGDECRASIRSEVGGHCRPFSTEEAEDAEKSIIAGIAEEQRAQRHACDG
jgi:hypothetical protein